MSIRLAHPPWDDFPSGGNVYNRNLVVAARRLGHSLASQPLDPEQVCALVRSQKEELTIFDSLFLEPLADAAPGFARHFGLLLHFLPSLDPGLGKAERQRLQAMEEKVVNTASPVIASGQSLRNILENRHPGKCFFLAEPGISAPFLGHSERSAAEPEVLRLLSVANLLPAKGLLDLLDALGGLSERRWVWHLAGDRRLDPEYAGRFFRNVAHLGLEERIVFHGPLASEQVAALMDASDLFLFPSRFESYGMALAEAVAKRLPAVSTRVGAAETLIRHGITGLLTAPGDIRGFAVVLRTALDDAELRQQFRTRLREARPRTWTQTAVDFFRAFEAPGRTSI